MPPTSRWIRIAITTHLKSVLCMRTATPSSASSRPTPRRLSTTTRLNSEVIGSVPSRTMVSSDWASDRPADRLPDISCSVSASPESNALSRFDRLNAR